MALLRSGYTNVVWCDLDRTTTALDVCFVNSLPVPWERRRPACFRSGLEARAPRRPYTGTGLVKWTSSLPLINAGFCCFSHPRQTDCTTSQLIESTNYANTALPVPMSGNITCRCGMCNAVIVSGATYGPRFSHTEKKTEIFSHFEMRERMTCCNRRWCSEHVSEEGLSRGEAGDTDQCLQTYWHQNCSCRFPAEVLARYCCRGEVARGESTRRHHQNRTG
jgi:hypothetical protein